MNEQKHNKLRIRAAIATVALSACTSALGAVVYSNDFENALDPLNEWSSSGTTVADGNGERFLGRFANDQSVTLSLDGLPVSDYGYVVSFDFYAIDSWDGEYTGEVGVGPDHFGVRIDGVEVFNETFNNMDGLHPWGDADQSFGGQNAPSGLYEPRTGAFANNVLLVEPGWGGTPRDASYRLSFAFQPADSAASIEFFGAGLQNPDDESWGIDNVTVRTLSADSVIPALSPGMLLLLVALLGAFGYPVLRRLTRRASSPG